jgi:hypothetical protein
MGLGSAFILVLLDWGFAGRSITADGSPDPLIRAAVRHDYPEAGGPRCWWSGRRLRRGVRVSLWQRQPVLPGEVTADVPGLLQWPLALDPSRDEAVELAFDV